MSTEYRRGIPSVAHVEAATRLGLEWHRQGCTDTHRTVFLVRDGVILSDYGLHPEQLNRTLNVSSTSGWEQRQSYRPIRPDGTPVDWEVLDAEVARVGQRGQPQTMACNLTASTQSQGFRADLWLALSSHLTPGNGCRLSDTVRLDWRGFRVQNPFFTAEIGWPGGFNSTDILVRWTVYQELKPLYDLVDGAQGEAAMPRDVEAEWYRAAQRPWTRPVDNWLLARDSTGLMIKNRYNMATWQPDEAGHGTPLRNFTAVLDAVAERRVAERMRGQTQASTVTAAQLDEPVLDEAALRSLILNLPNVASITSRIERGSRQRDRYIVRVQLADPNVPLDRALAAQIPRNVHVHCEGRGDGGQRGVGGTASSIFSPTGNREDAVVPPIQEPRRVNVEPRRFADVRPDRHGWRWWRDLTNGYCFTIRDGVYVQRVDAASDPWSALDLSAWLNRTVIPTDEQGNPVSWESIGQGLSGNSIDAVLIDDALGPISPTQPTPLPRFTADELDDVDHSATTTQDSAILKRGKLPTVEAIGKYREVMAKRNGTVTEAVKASGIDCEVAQYVLERWAGGLSDREAEIICDEAYGAVSFTRADIAKRLSHWFAIIRTLDTSEPADTAAQRQRAEAAERQARMAALQAQLAKERAARVAEPIEELSRFALLEVDEAADPSKSIEAWKAQRAALKRASVVRPVPAPQPTPPPRRKPFEVVDAQADGLSGGAAFAVLLSRAMNQNC